MGRQDEDESPFHAGERAVQQQLGVRDDIEPWGRKVVHGYLPEEHRAFHAALPFLVLAARDAAGRPWATLLAGSPGFAHSPDPRSLVIASGPVAGDALDGALGPGADVGLLGIELATRRRNRVNGRVASNSNGELRVDVDQAFGNCPQYITEREWQSVSGATAKAAPRTRADRLTKVQMDRIRRADTLFIATGHRGRGEHAAFGMDASHRGGPRGFVAVRDARTLVLPDYAGNNHFNTIGNLVLDPRAGLVFVDFETGGLLQLTGTVEVDWSSDEVGRVPGARRLLRFTLAEAIELEEALPLRWRAEGGGVRSLRLVQKLRESDDVYSFVLAARDGEPLPAFEAGQYLPLEVAVPGRVDPVRRTYSLSNGPGDGEYRISVKREPRGLVSRYLHDEVEPGAILSARAPAGEFVLGAARRPVALVSAGIGVTPMVSMLHALVEERARRQIWFVHGARDRRVHALAGEVAELARTNPAVNLHVAFSRPQPNDRRGRDYDSVGRVDANLLAALVPDLEAEFYLCGPVAFLADVQSGLEGRGVPGERIHSESFGPVG